MLTPKRLAAPQRFAIETINFMFIDTSMETELAFSDSVVFDFRHGSKWYAKSLLSMLEIGSYAELDVLRRCTYCERVHVHMSCPGCGSSNFSVLSTSKEQPLTSHRTKRTVYTHRMIAPHVISYDMDFGIEFNHSLNELKLPPFTLKCWFEGLHARAVQ